MDVDSEMARLQRQIEKAENDIEKVENDIKKAGNIIQLGNLTPEDKQYWREKERALREKERALRDKELALREERALLVDGSRRSQMGVKRKMIGFTLANAREQAENIRKSYFKDPEFLWDTYSALLLPYPGMDKKEIYVGREAAEGFYKAVMGLSPRERLLVMGAKGSGKSTVAKAIVGTLIASGKPALYMTLSQIREKNECALLNGLLLAFPEKEKELPEVDWEELIWWLAFQKGPVYLFIDDWDPADIVDLITDEIFGNFTFVKISSTNSSAHRAYFDTDKPYEKYGKLISLDGPYTEQELETWMDNSGLLQKFEGKIGELYVCLENWTGRMPGLLQVFADVEGDEIKMMKYLKYHAKRLQGFIDDAKTQNDLHTRFLMVTQGAQFLGDFDSTCFYQDKLLNWHILCPYLRRRGKHDFG